MFPNDLKSKACTADNPRSPLGNALSRITVVAGHYGSGKTTIAANLAVELRKRHERVTLCDLDIVNPYFRTIDHREALEAAGVKLISSELAGTGVESPGFPPDAAAVFDDTGVTAVIDVGGDDRGALALGRYAERLRQDVSVLLVINKYRPLSANAKDACGICREIEAAGRFRFTGIINNSNLGVRTTPGDILSSLPYSGEIAKRLGLPVVAHSVMRGIEISEPNLWFLDIL
jgi:energy-coupling factor transporter ATP-binding protein EcfA2